VNYRWKGGVKKGAATMTGAVAWETKVIPFPSKKKVPRKAGLNRNHEGSVRSINGKLYVDFIYFGERVREKSGLEDTKDNSKHVRQQLNKIIVAIKAGTFRFAEVFPQSKKREYFGDKEREAYGHKKMPDEVNIKDYTWEWYNDLKGSGRVSQRTLYGYKTYINLYIVPFFDKMTFGDLESIGFDKFIGWAKRQCYRKKPIGNETMNKIFVPLKMICKSARKKFKWVGYDPFDDFEKLPEGDTYEKIMPFSIKDQKLLIENMPDHWKPYFQFAFSSGLRQGEQCGLKIDDIDWEKQIIHVRRAITKDADGKKMEGPTKNIFSRRDIKFSPEIHKALKAQLAIYEKFKGEYFFCDPNGCGILPASLRKMVWVSALKKSNMTFREMKQTRHSFATIALSCGESPLWIAKTMGHRDTDMIIRVYGKYVENASGSKDGIMLNAAYQCAMSNYGEETVR
jgi:integrase